MANELIVLITGLVGLVGTAIGTYFAVKNWVSNMKGKNKTEIWGLIMEIADKAMTEAEASGKAGADKKAMVIAAIQAGTEAAGIDMGPFLTQLDSYIDQTIDFVNKMKTAKSE